jgi:hypothetical protein
MVGLGCVGSPRIQAGPPDLLAGADFLEGNSKGWERRTRKVNNSSNKARQVE